MRIPRFRGDLPQRRHYRPSELAPGRAKRRLPHGGISLGHCRWPARGSFSVSASAAKSWPQSRQRYVWVWAWTNLGNCPSSVLRPAAWTLASVGGGHVLAPCRSTFILGCASAPTCRCQQRSSSVLVCRTNLRRQAGWESSGFGICGWTGRPPLGSCTPKILRGAPIRPRASRRFPPNRGSPPALAGPSE